MSDHFLEHFIDREYDGQGKINHTFSQIVEYCKKEPNYTDTRNNREIIRIDKINIIKEKDKYISLRKDRVSSHWKKI